MQMTDMSPKYAKDIVFLLDQGKERLIEGSQRGIILLPTALKIARANQNSSAKGEDG
jgi:ParB family chromosome partitioning protein